MYSTGIGPHSDPENHGFDPDQLSWSLSQDMVLPLPVQR